jgi:hypothetical protein
MGTIEHPPEASPQRTNSHRGPEDHVEVSEAIALSLSKFYIGVLKKGRVAVLMMCTGAGRFANNSNWAMACSISTSKPFTNVQPLNAFCRINLKRFVSSRW